MYGYFLQCLTIEMATAANVLRFKYLKRKMKSELVDIKKPIGATFNRGFN